MRVFVGAFLAGCILYYFAAWQQAGAGCFVAGGLAALMLLQLGPRSIVEKVGFLMTVAFIAWFAGPSSGTLGSTGFVRYLLGWLLASSVIAFYLHPRSE